MFTELIHVGLTGAFLLLPPSAAMHVDDPEGLGTLMPYGPAPTVLEPAPAGYKPVFVESLNRHGSRALAGPGNVDNALALWQRASDEEELTPLGQRFGADARALRAVNLRMGYGNLSALGEDELRGIGARTAARTPELFADADVELVSSGVRRATESAENFAKGLKVGGSGVHTDKPVVDRELLRFDESDAAYRQFLDSDGPTLDALDRVEDAPRVVKAAKATLGRLYRPAFVAGIAEPVAEARAIFGLYAIGPAMRKESTTDFSDYLDDDAPALAYVNDARYFYQRGPGIKGRDESFAPARVLLDDFFDQAQRRLDGGATAAVLRFGHAEQVIPFAALLKLPGSEKQASPDHVYSPGNNPWRGAQVSRLAANIQWVVYAKNGGPPLVAMLYNEQQIPFKAGCTPVADDSYLYALEELRTCLR